MEWRPVEVKMVYGYQHLRPGKMLPGDLSAGLHGTK